MAMLEASLKRHNIHNKVDYLKTFLKSREDNVIIKLLFLKSLSYYYAQRTSKMDDKYNRTSGSFSSDRSTLAHNFLFAKLKKRLSVFYQRSFKHMKMKIKNNDIRIYMKRNNRSIIFLNFEFFLHNYFNDVTASELLDNSSSGVSLKSLELRCFSSFNVNGNAKENQATTTGECLILPELKNKVETPWWLRSKRATCDAMFFSPVSTPVREKMKRQEKAFNSKEGTLEKRRQHRDNRPRPWKAVTFSKNKSTSEKSPENKRETESKINSRKQLQAGDTKEFDTSVLQSPIPRRLAVTKHLSNDPQRKTLDSGKNRKLIHPKSDSNTRKNMSQSNDKQVNLDGVQKDTKPVGNFPMNGLYHNLFKRENGDHVGKESNMHDELQHTKNEPIESYFDAISCSDVSPKMMFSPLQGFEGEEERQACKSNLENKKTPSGVIRTNISVSERKLKRQYEPYNKQGMRHRFRYYDICSPASSNRQRSSMLQAGIGSSELARPIHPKATVTGRKRGPIILETSPPLLSLRAINPITAKARSMIDSYSKFLNGEVYTSESNNSKNDQEPKIVTKNINRRTGKLSPERKPRKKMEKKERSPEDFLLKCLSPTRTIAMNSSPISNSNHLNSDVDLQNTNTKDDLDYGSDFNRITFKREHSGFKQSSEDCDGFHQNNTILLTHPDENKSTDNHKLPTYFENFGKRNISQSIPSLLKKVNQDIEKKVRSMVESYSRFLMEEQGLVIQSPKISSSNSPQRISPRYKCASNYPPFCESNFRSVDGKVAKRSDANGIQTIRHKQFRTDDELERCILNKCSDQYPHPSVSKKGVNNEVKQKTLLLVNSESNHEIKQENVEITSPSRITVVRTAYINQNEEVVSNPSPNALLQLSPGQIAPSTRCHNHDMPDDNETNKQETNSVWINLESNQEKKIKVESRKDWKTKRDKTHHSQSTMCPKSKSKEDGYTIAEVTKVCCDFPKKPERNDLCRKLDDVEKPIMMVRSPKTQTTEHILRKSRAIRNVVKKQAQNRNEPKICESNCRNGWRDSTYKTDIKEMAMPANNSFSRWYSNTEKGKAEAIRTKDEESHRLSNSNHATKKNHQTIIASKKMCGANCKNTISPSSSPSSQFCASYSPSVLGCSSPSCSCCAETSSETRLDLGEYDCTANLFGPRTKQYTCAAKTHSIRKDERRVRFPSNLLKKNVGSESEDTKAMRDSITSSWDDETTGSQITSSKLEQKGERSNDNPSVSQDHGMASMSNQTRSEVDSTTQKRDWSNHSEDDEFIKDSAVSNDSSESTMRNIPDLDVNDDVTLSTNTSSNLNTIDMKGKFKIKRRNASKQNETKDFNFSNKGAVTSNSAPCLSSSFDKSSLPPTELASCAKSVSDTYLFNHYINNVFKLLKKEFKKDIKKKGCLQSRKSDRTILPTKSSKQGLGYSNKGTFNNSNVAAREMIRGDCVDKGESVEFLKQNRVRNSLANDKSSSFFSIDQGTHTKQISTVRQLKRTEVNSHDTGSPKSLPSFDEVLTFWEQAFGRKREFGKSRLERRTRKPTGRHYKYSTHDRIFDDVKSPEDENNNDEKWNKEVDINEHSSGAINDCSESFVSLCNNDDFKLKSSFMKIINATKHSFDGGQELATRNTSNNLNDMGSSCRKQYLNQQYSNMRKRRVSRSLNRENSLSPYAIVANMASSVKSHVMNVIEHVLSPNSKRSPPIKQQNRLRESPKHRDKRLSAKQYSSRRYDETKRVLNDKVKKSFWNSKIPVPIPSKQSNHQVKRFVIDDEVRHLIAETPKSNRYPENGIRMKPITGSKIKNISSLSEHTMYTSYKEKRETTREEDNVYYRLSSGLDTSPSLMKEGKHTLSRSSKPITHLALDSPLDTINKINSDYSFSIGDTGYDQDKLLMMKYLARESQPSKPLKNKKRFSGNGIQQYFNLEKVSTTDKESTFAGNTDNLGELTFATNKIQDSIRNQSSNMLISTKRSPNKPTKSLSTSFRKNEYKPTVSVGISPTVSKEEMLSPKHLGVLDSPSSDIEVGKRSATLNSKTGSMCETTNKITNILTTTTMQLKQKDDHFPLLTSPPRVPKISVPNKHSPPKSEPNSDGLKQRSITSSFIGREVVCIGCQTNTDEFIQLRKVEMTNASKENTHNNDSCSKMVQTSPRFRKGHLEKNIKDNSDKSAENKRTEVHYSLSSDHPDDSSITEGAISTTFNYKRIPRESRKDSKDTLSSSTPERGSGDCFNKEAFTEYKHEKPKGNVRELQTLKKRSKNKTRPTSQTNVNKEKEKHNKKYRVVYKSSSEQNISKTKGNHPCAENPTSKREKLRHERLKPSTSDSDVLSMTDNRHLASISDDYNIQLSQASKHSTVYQVRRRFTDQEDQKKKNDTDSLSNFVHRKEKAQQLINSGQRVSSNNVGCQKVEKDRNRQHNSSKNKDGRGIEIVLGEDLPVEKFVNSFIGGLKHVSKPPFNTYGKAEELMKLPRKKSVVVQLSPSPIRKYPFKHRRPGFRDIGGCQPNFCFSNSGYSKQELRPADFQWKNATTEQETSRSRHYPQYGEHLHKDLEEENSYNKLKQSRRQIFEDSTKKKHGVKYCCHSEKHQCHKSGMVSPTSSRTNTITESRTFCNDFTLRSSHCSNENHCVTKEGEDKKTFPQEKSSHARREKVKKTCDLPEKKPSHTVCVTAPCSFPLRGRTVNAILSSDPNTMKKQVELRFMDTETSQTSKIVVEPETEDEPSWPNVVSKNGHVFVTFHKDKESDDNKPEKETTSSQDKCKGIENTYRDDSKCRRNESNLKSDHHQRLRDEISAQKQTNKCRKKFRNRNDRETGGTSTDRNDHRLKPRSRRNMSVSTGEESDEPNYRTYKEGKRKKKYYYSNVSPTTSHEHYQNSPQKPKWLKDSKRRTEDDIEGRTKLLQDQFQKRQLYGERHGVISGKSHDKMCSGPKGVKRSEEEINSNQKTTMCTPSRERLFEKQTKNPTTNTNTNDIESTEIDNPLLPGQVQNLIKRLQEYSVKERIESTNPRHDDRLTSDQGPDASTFSSQEEQLKYVHRRVKSQMQLQASQTSGDTEQSKLAEQTSSKLLSDQSCSQPDNLQNSSLLNINDTVLRNAVLKVISENIARLYSDTERSGHTNLTDTPNSEVNNRCNREVTSETVIANTTANKISTGSDLAMHDSDKHDGINAIPSLQQPKKKRELQRSADTVDDIEEDTWENEKTIAPETSIFDQLEKVMLPTKNQPSSELASTYFSRSQHERESAIKREDSGYITPKGKELDYQHYLREHRVKPGYTSSTEDMTERSCTEEIYSKNKLKKEQRRSEANESRDFSRGLLLDKQRQVSSDHSIETQDSFMKACDATQLTPMKGPFSIRQYGISQGQTPSWTSDQIQPSNMTSDGISSGNNTPSQLTSTSKDRQAASRVWWRDQEGPLQKLQNKRASFKVSHLPSGRRSISVKQDTLDLRPSKKEKPASTTPAADRIYKRYQDTVHISPRFAKKTFIHRKIGNLRDRSLSGERRTTGVGANNSRINKNPFSYNSQSSVVSSNVEEGMGGSIGESKPVDAWDRAVVDKLKSIRSNKYHIGSR